MENSPFGKGGIIAEQNREKCPYKPNKPAVSKKEKKMKSSTDLVSRASQHGWTFKTLINPNQKKYLKGVL